MKSNNLRLRFIIRTRCGSVGIKGKKDWKGPENFTFFYEGLGGGKLNKIQVLEVEDRTHMFDNLSCKIVEDFAKIELSKRSDYIFGLCNLNDSLVFLSKEVKEDFIQLISEILHKKMSQKDDTFQGVV